MKKLFITLVLIGLSFISYGQVYWPINPVYISENDNAKLGTDNQRSLNIVTNNQVRLIADSVGHLQIKGLAGRGYRLLYVDSVGNIGARNGDGEQTEWQFSCDDPNTPPDFASEFDPFPCPSRPCHINSGPWFEGGNSIGTSGNSAVGTCSFHDFILKSNGTDRVWIKTDGKIGIGTSTPIGSFELKNATDAEIIATNTSVIPHHYG